MDSIDYDSIADIYDTYVDTTYDFAFFTDEIRPNMQVLELTSGTGRLSIPLIRAGAHLTCVDVSQGMLRILAHKLEVNKYTAELVCADIEYLSLARRYELAILPFQSFMELIGEKKQLHTLRAVYRSLIPGGRFFCTMHNPQVRRNIVDGLFRSIGSFLTQEGTLVVSGVETGGTPVVSRNQFFEFFNDAGRLVKKQLLKMEFQFIEREQFAEMAAQAGFVVNALYGNYDRNEFHSSTSPVMIWELKRDKT